MGANHHSEKVVGAFLSVGDDIPAGFRFGRVGRARRLVGLERALAVLELRRFVALRTMRVGDRHQAPGL